MMAFIEPKSLKNHLLLEKPDYKNRRQTQFFSDIIAVRLKSPINAIAMRWKQNGVGKQPGFCKQKLEEDTIIKILQLKISIKKFYS